MKAGTLPALALIAVAGACAEPPAYPPGAVEHGPYLDRSFEGFVVRAFYETDLTVLTVQPAETAPEPKPEQVTRARELLWTGDVDAPDPLTPIAVEAARFEAAAQEAAGIPGWCRSETRFAFLSPVPGPLGHPFGIRASYSAEIGGFIFAGQCRPVE